MALDGAFASGLWVHASGRYGSPLVGESIRFGGSKVGGKVSQRGGNFTLVGFCYLLGVFFCRKMAETLNKKNRKLQGLDKSIS